MSERLFSIFYQSHAGSWFFTILFFLLSFILLKARKRVPQKATQMIFRLFSLIMIVTGIGMLIGLHFPLTYIIKGILAIILIGTMEMILARGKKGGGAKPQWILFVIILIIVLMLGFRVI